MVDSVRLGTYIKETRRVQNRLSVDSTGISAKLLTSDTHGSPTAPCISPVSQLFNSCFNMLQPSTLHTGICLDNKNIWLNFFFFFLYRKIFEL